MSQQKQSCLRCAPLRNQILKEVYIVRKIKRAINSTYEFSGRVTVKSKLDGTKFRRFKGVGTRTSYVVAYVDATISFRSKMKRKKVVEQNMGCCQ